MYSNISVDRIQNKSSISKKFKGTLDKENIERNNSNSPKKDFISITEDEDDSNKNLMTTSELMKKIQEFHNFAYDFELMRKKQDTLLDRLQKVETQLKNTIISDILHQQMNLAKDELRNYTDIKQDHLQIELNAIENNVIPKNILQDTMSKLVSIETIDKLYRDVRGLKTDIEKSMEIKINAELSDFKIDLAKKLTIEDAEIQFSKLVNNDDFENQLQKFNNQINNLIPKKNSWDHNHHDVSDDDDQSESQEKELEDSQPIKQNFDSKYNQNLDNNTSNENTRDDKKTIHRKKIMHNQVNHEQKELIDNALSNLNLNDKNENSDTSINSKTSNKLRRDSIKKMDSIKPSNEPNDHLNQKSLNIENLSSNKENIEIVENQRESPVKDSVDLTQLLENRDKIDINRDKIEYNKNTIDQNRDKIEINKNTIDQIKSDLENALTLLKEKSNTIDQINTEFQQFKTQQHGENTSRDEITRIFKNLESEVDKNKSINDQIKNNLLITDEYLANIKDTISYLETKSKGSNESSKSIVKLKVGLDSLINELGYFKKEINKKIDVLVTEQAKNKINKENIKSNFENIIHLYTSKLKLITNEIDEIKVDQEKIKKPLTEQMDLLNMELKQLNSRTDHSQLLMDEILVEYKGLINSSRDSTKDQNHNIKNRVPLFKNKDLESRITNYPKYVSKNSITLPNIASEQRDLTNDISEISMRAQVQDNVKHSNELRAQISRMKQGVQSADPSRKIENKTTIGFRVNKFDSLKNNRMNQSIY